jgi:hypothetical protein
MTSTLESFLFNNNIAMTQSSLEFLKTATAQNAVETYSIRSQIVSRIFENTVYEINDHTDSLFIIQNNKSKCRFI